MENEERIEKLREGLDNNFCTDIVCEMHDGVPMTDEENEAMEEGMDPCVFVVRINTEMQWVAPFATREEHANQSG